MKLTFSAVDRAEWRTWLENNFRQEKEVWLIFYRAQSGQECITYDASVEEALCFGWVDSIIQKIDDQRYARKFTPRQPGSPWSPSNRIRVARLVQEGRMTAAGLEKIPFPIAEAESPDRLQRPAPMFSPELQQLLQSHAQAWEFFQKLPPSQQKRHVGWIMDAKKDETRRKRLAEVIELFEQGKRMELK